MKHSRAMYTAAIPKDAIYQNTGFCEVYQYVNSHGQIVAMGFIGKQSKPTLHVAFRSEKQRSDYVNDWINGLQKYEDLKAERRAKSKADHSLKVGDILDGSWGYDQTNVDFYQVVEVKSPKTVVIREIASQTVEWNDHAWSGQCMPVKDKFTGDPMVKRPSGDNHIKMTSYLWISPWDGEPKYFSDGH